MGLTKTAGLLLSSLLYGVVTQTLAATSILIWPIDPVLEDKQSATALWLENKDSKVVYVQIRLLRWQQQASEEQLTEQKEVIVSPPMAELKPGQKQLIRLIKNTQLAANEERAFRILVDEIPRTNESAENHEGLGLKFQMRYSVPLFVQGANLWTKQDYKKPRDLSKASQPVLHYKLLNQGKEQWLVVNNTGPVHARLSKVVFKQGHQSQWVTEGLLGYVLAGSESKFMIPNKAYTGTLEAHINNNPSPVVINNH